MKVFKNPLNKKEFVNQYGETMTMVMSSDANMWIHHNDCNEDFEKLSIFTTNFILNAEELLAITEFVKECVTILKKNSK
jgi:hypothetical protein